MRNFLYVFLSAVLMTPSAFAADFSSSFTNSFFLNQTRDLAPITITATSAGEITSEKGIQIIFDNEKKILWDAVSSLSATGSAVTNSKILANPVPVYKNDYKTLFIPVTADFDAGESVTLSGIRLRVYKTAFLSTYLSLDVNGDGVGDVQDVNKIEASQTEGTDFTAPYPVTDVSVVANSSFTQVALSWQPSPDYDSQGTNITRKRVHNGNTQEASLLLNSTLTTFTDTDVTPGDILTYTFDASDGRNFSEPVVQTITLEPSVPEIPAQPAPTPELDSLNRLYSSYKLRYAIKCFPSGVARPEGDAACLWSKIDLLYTQAKTGRSDITASFTARETDLIALRLPFSQNRYQTQCIEAVAPAPYCTALGKALDRAEYLLK